MDVKAMSDLFSLIFGAAISYGFKVIPFLDSWYQNKLDANLRGLFMLGVSLLVPVGVYLVSCAGIFNLVPCSTTIWADMARAWLYFVGANIGIFMMTPASKANNMRKDAEKGLLEGSGREAVANQHPRGDQE